MHKPLTKLILTLLAYPTATLLTSIIIGTLTGEIIKGILKGLEILAYSLTGIIPLIGPLIYLYVVLPQLKPTPWIIPTALGLITAISYTTITTRLIIDLLKQFRYKSLN